MEPAPFSSHSDDLPREPQRPFPQPARRSPAEELRVQVGRLALDGFHLPPGGEGQVRAAFEAELRRLLSLGEIPAGLRSGGARRELPGEPLSIGAWSDPADLGHQIAQALYKGMRG